MNNEHFASRTELLIGKEKVQRLAGKIVFVAGLGGVGSFAVEALVRSGVGHLILVDGDVISISNLNRQLLALYSTLGRSKTEVARERIQDIAPDCRVDLRTLWLTSENIASLLNEPVDYIIDAIDQVDAKVALILEARKKNIPILSVMGTGNQMSAAHFHISDIGKTHNCPLARAVRLRLRKLGVYSGVKVLYSLQQKQTNQTGLENTEIAEDIAPSASRRPIGSIGFVPPVAGMLAAGEVIRDLLDQEPGNKEEGSLDESALPSH